MNIQSNVPRASLWLIMIVSLLAGLVACRPQEITLSFETIEIGKIPPAPSRYEGKEPKLIIISGVDEIVALGNSVSPEAEMALRQLDFGRYFAVAAYQGRKPWVEYGVEIKQIVYQDNAVTLYAHFSAPQPDQQLRPIETSPYHLVKVQKEGLSGEKEFILNADGTIVDQQTHALP